MIPIAPPNKSIAFANPTGFGSNAVNTNNNKEKATNRETKR